MEIKKIILTLILLTTFICGCKKKTDPAIIKTITPADFLSASTFKKLYVDLVYDKGFPPTTETISNLKSFLAATVNKPDGIEIALREINGLSKQKLSLADVQAVETENRIKKMPGTSITIFVYMCNAEYNEAEGNYKILGIQYGSSSIVLFGSTIRASSGGLGEPSLPVLETSVMHHEFGHAFGLVDAGTAMVTPHTDSQHGHHCNNQNCLMYYAVETTDIVANILGGKVPPLDVNCNNDLRANGGK